MDYFPSRDKNKSQLEHIRDNAGFGQVVTAY